jgi:hypothetical protein
MSVRSGRGQTVSEIVPRTVPDTEMDGVLLLKLAIVLICTGAITTGVGDADAAGQSSALTRDTATSERAVATSKPSTRQCDTLTAKPRAAARGEGDVGQPGGRPNPRAARAPGLALKAWSREG